jgi:gliding motility-associated-like protein
MQLPQSLFASHIVGGEIGYKCLGGDDYEITVSLYRDCYFGAPDAPFDDPASIGIFDRNGLLVQELLIPFSHDDTLDAVLFDECLFVPETVCVHTTNYTGTVTLPFLEGGYQIVYQRCCRNQTIANIIAPDETGATYDIFLTEEAMMDCNSSPTFKEWPPIFICVNNPIFFDHSAEDPDGDSLVYKLCTPLAGASFGVPQPQPPNNPPYDSVVWVSPTFSLDNLLGQGDPLEINPQTGLITGMPTLQGQFVVGICVEEYDRTTGDLKSTTRRDFQYNVGQCGTVISSIFAPDAQCDDLTVDFVNNSDNSDDFEWYFDWPNNTLSSTTTDSIVTFTFPDTGRYTVALIAEPTSACADTSYHEIYLQNNSLTADFQVDVFDCDTEALVQLVDVSTDAISPVVQWDWELIYSGTDTLNSTEQSPTFSVPLFVSGVVTLTATTQNGCIQTITKPFETGLDNPGIFVIPNLDACVGDSLYLNPNTPSDIQFNYSWSPADGLSDPTAVSPRVLVTEDITYTVTITPLNNICEIIKTVEVNAVPMPMLDFETSSDCEGLEVTFNNNSLNASTFVWDFGDGNTSNLVSPTHTYAAPGDYTVTLRVADGALCKDTLIRQISVIEKMLSADFEANYQACSEEEVSIQFNDISTNNLNNTQSWDWSFSNGANSDEQNPLIVVNGTQTLSVTLTITTEEGCTSTTTQDVEVNVLDDITLVDSLLVCFGGSTTLSPAGNPNYNYQWSPTTGIDDPTSPTPTFSPTETTVYTATISAFGADTCSVTREVTVFVTPDINLQVSGDNTTCENTTTLVANSDVAVDYVWSTAGFPALSTDAELTVDVSGTTEYTVTATDQYGCSVAQDISVSGGPVDVAVPDVSAVCLGEELTLSVNNLDGNDVLSYSWSPADVFESGTETSATPNYIETVGEQMVYVTITNQFGCEYQDSILAAVIDPNFQLGFDSELQCNGATVEFTNTSTDAFGFIWDFGDGTSSTETNPSHTYNTIGTYDVTLTLVYDVSCADTLTQPVEIIDPQIIAGFDHDIMACSPDSAEVAFFDTSVNSFNNTAQWEWIFSNGQISNAENPVITVTESGELIVTLTITSANDCEATVTDTINIELIELNLPDTLIICQGESTQLNPNGNNAYAYLWSPAETLDDPTAVNPTATPTETTAYSVTIQSFGSDTCEIVQEVVVFVAPDINLTLNDDITTCGEDAELTATTSTGTDISWVDSQGNNVGSGPSVTVNPFTTETYTATATDQYGCTDMQSVTVTDNGVDVETSGDVQACQAEEVIINVNNLDANDVLTHSWTPLENILTDPTQAEITVSVEAGSVTFINNITNQNGCSTTAEITVSVVPFQIDVPDSVQVCYGETAKLAPDADPNLDYQWSPEIDLIDANTSNPTFIGLEDRVYTVTITDNSNGVACMTTREVSVDVTEPMNLLASADTTICEILDVTLTANSSLDGVELEWFDANNTSIGTGSPITVTPEEGTNTYSVFATDLNGCVDTATVTVTAALVETGIQDVANICVNTPTELNPGGNPDLIYTWSPEDGLDLSNPWNPVADIDMDQTYMVTITDATGSCVIEDEIFVDAYDAINMQVSGDTIACGLSNVSFTASSEQTATFEWFDANGNSVFTGSTLITEVSESTSFTVIGTDANGCQETETVAVNNEEINALINSGIVFCVPVDEYIIEVTNLNPAHELSYVWSPNVGDGPSITVNPTENATDEYSVELTNQYGCSTTLTASVQVIVFEDILSIVADPDTIRLGDDSELSVFGCDDCEYSWDWPSGTLSVDGDATVIATPDELGPNIYTVNVDQNGCSADLSVEVFVRSTLCDEPHIFMPNAFSPNNDGENDRLRVRGSFIDSYQLMIYNRWGEEVFSAESLGQSWDGTYKGEQLPPDIYGYYLQVNCPNGQVFTKQGNITLLR